MKKNYLILLIMLMFINISAQVGINTNTPSATLHVQKRAPLDLPDGIIPPRITGDSLRLKDAAYGAAQNGALVYVTSATTTSSTKTGNVSSPGIYMYDATALSGGGAWSKLAQGPGDGAYSAKFVSSFSLLGIAVGANNINLNIGGTGSGTTTVQVPSTSMSNGIYTVPSTGTYQITYNYKEGSGASVSLLTNSGISIMRTPFGSSTPVTLDSKGFGGISVALVLTVSITQTSISHIYNLNAGDRIQFAVNRVAVVGIDLTTTNETDVSIYKIR